MAIDNRTANRSYPLPHANNLQRSEDLPRLIETITGIDADIAALIAGLATKAAAGHTHELAEIVGLVAALAGKASVSHTHGISTLNGVDLSGAASGQFMRFNGTLWAPAALATADLPNDGVTNAKLRNSAAASVIGRAANSAGDPADIQAAANDRLLARVNDALAFTQLTFAMIAAAAIASAADIRAGAASKLLTPSEVLAAMAYVDLTSAATITIDHAAGVKRKITLGHNAAFATPANGKEGWPLVLRIAQDGTGGRVPSWSSAFKWGSLGQPVLSTGAGKVDVLFFECTGSGEYTYLGMNRGIV